MSCSLCSGDCDGEVDTSLKSLDFDIGYQDADCKIDDDESNKPWWVDIDIDSDRGGKVYLKIELSALNGDISIDEDKNPKEIPVQSNASGKDADFKISQSTGNNPSSSDTIEIDIEWKQRKNGNYSSLTNLSVDRRLSSNP